MKLEGSNLSNLNYIEEMWERYREKRESVSENWRVYFDELEHSPAYVDGADAKLTIGREQLAQGFGPSGRECAGCGRAAAMSLLQYNVSQLVRNFRVRGHLAADNNPLYPPKPLPPELEPSYYGMSEFDLELIFRGGHMGKDAPLTLREILTVLKETYTGSIGVQFMHIDSLSEREWLQERMEARHNHPKLSRARQVRIFERLCDAVVFEQFLQKKYVGAKAFSLEGAETLVPLLDMAIEKAASQGIENVVIGMPHRGRLNVLANIMGKVPRTIFGEFEDPAAEARAMLGRGDVKYHKGYHRRWISDSGAVVNLDLTFNPSHLEFVGPVAQGALRAMQIARGDTEIKKGLLILIHGDAAVAGEGIVQETINLSELPDFSVAGTLHVVVNNQIGFTTLSRHGRSTTYASDVFKSIQSPIFHVNGEQPDAVAQALDLSMDFRAQFGRDVVIDMLCYRRRGHNEGDEPTFTQPRMYRRIKAKPTVMDAYMEHLLALGEISGEEARQIAAARQTFLDEEFTAQRSNERETNGRPSLFDSWSGPYVGGLDKEVPEVDTRVSAEQLRSLATRIWAGPEGFHVHPKLQKIHRSRIAAVERGKGLDWGCGELLALGSLLEDGVPVRLCGQDSQRGTFSHRHSVLHDVEDASEYVPLAHLSEHQARVDIVNSPLTEGAVLGFEYGYSTAHPQTLVIWEAQFGDFANAAQVYIDQFIASGEAKWNLLSGLVMLLPHGMEGMGPEHASARLERYLSLAATDNYQVVYPTTPSQIFHLLRRQALRTIRKPLIVMSPKSMLRHPQAVSTLDDFTERGYQKLIIDSEPNPKEIGSILLCTGKIYYELLAAREQKGATHVSVVRLEQLYPMMPGDVVDAIDDAFPESGRLIWVQEEPLNMGAYPFIRGRFARYLEERWAFSRVGRPESATPATGSLSAHKLEQQRVIDAAYRLAAQK